MRHHPAFEGLRLQTRHEQTLLAQQGLQGGTRLGRRQGSHGAWFEQTQPIGKTRRLKQQRTQARGVECLGRLLLLGASKTSTVQQLQRPFAIGQHLRAQLRHVTVFDVGAQGHLKNAPLEVQVQLIGLRRHQRLHHLPVDQTQLLGDGRLHVDLPNLQLHRQHRLNAVNAFWPKQGHGIRGIGPSFFDRWDQTKRRRAGANTNAANRRDWAPTTPRPL